MRFGVTLPNGGLGANPELLGELALTAERSEWDGVFVWDSFQPGHEIAPDPRDPVLAPVIDPWVALTTIATEPALDRTGRALGRRDPATARR